MNIGIIIQVRINSERLPEKALKNIGSKEMLSFLVDRLKKIQGISKIVIATSDNTTDDILENFAKKLNLELYRGSLNDVLNRFYSCALKYNLDGIVRVTADDPFKDPMVIKQALDIFITRKFDYVSNTLLPTYPEGIDIEVFSFNALEKANKEAKLDSDRLHVTPYIWRNPDIFSLFNFIDTNDNSNIRLTCDYPEDLDYLNKIYGYTIDDNFTYLDLIEIIKENAILNEKETIRNEGYLNDKKEENK